MFLTTRVLPVPHVEDADRYVVSRVEALPGFYGVAQFLGFRDEAALRFDEIIARVGELEERHAYPDNIAAARRRVEQLLELARHPTHVCVSVSPSLVLFSYKLVLMAHRSIPHYTPKSKSLVMGRLTPIANYLRRVLIEDIYGRLSKPTYNGSFGKQ